LLHIISFTDDNNEALSFASKMYLKLKKWHDFLYRERDPNNEGIIYIRHPWESGMDNSPAFDDVLEKIQSNAAQIPDYEREDIKFVDKGQRPSD